MSQSNGYATPEQLFGSPARRRYADVTVSLGKFRLRSLNAREMAEYQAEAISKTGEMSRRGAITANVRLIVLCCVNKDGDPILSKSNIAQLQEIDAAQIAELADACREHCGLGEDAAKNYDTDPADDSRCD